MAKIWDRYVALHKKLIGVIGLEQDNRTLANIVGDTKAGSKDAFGRKDHSINISPQDTLSVSERLELDFQNYRDGGITLDDYYLRILDEKRLIEETKADFKLELRAGIISKEDFNQEIEDISDDMAEVNWRLSWVQNQQTSDD